MSLYKIGIVETSLNQGRCHGRIEQPQEEEEVPGEEKGIKLIHADATVWRHTYSVTVPWFVGSVLSF